MTRDELAEAVVHAASVEFTRSGRPGGQHVNTSSTQVILRVPLDRLGLDGATTDRVRRRLGHRVTDAGDLLIRSSETRSQHDNRERAVARAVALIDDARVRRRPRKPTRPGRAARERRLTAKRIRSRRKDDRRPPRPE